MTKIIVSYAPGFTVGSTMGVMCFGVWAMTEHRQLEAVIVMSSSSMALGKERRAGYDG